MAFLKNYHTLHENCVFYTAGAHIRDVITSEITILTLKSVFYEHPAGVHNVDVVKTNQLYNRLVLCGMAV